MQSIGEPVEYHEAARIAVINRRPLPPTRTTILVMCAGTSDIPVAEEAAVTAEVMGNRVERLCDVGVAGIHRLLAVCDVDKSHMERGVKAGGKDCKGYHDFREVLARNDIDVAHIVTPPHWHALMSIAAAEAGKDIWCEKPMSRTIGEGLAMRKAVQEKERIFRINTWFRFRSGLYGLGAPAEPRAPRAAKASPMALSPVS